MKVVTVDEMRELERRAGELGLPGPALMENAGRTVSDVVDRVVPGRRRRALVLVGPGNNGGDGLVAARHLHDAGFATQVYRFNRSTTADAKDLLLRQRGIPILDHSDDPALTRLDDALRDVDVVVDALLGTGRARSVAEPLGAMLDRVNQMAARRVVAVDLPTGVDANTGAADPRAVRARLTVALGFPKRGLVLGPAVDHVGQLVVRDIGIPAELAAGVRIAYAEVPDVAGLLPRRTRNSNKGTYGRTLIVSGSELYTGAPVLAARAAERVGAGLVSLGCPASVRPILAAHTQESTFLPLPDDGSGALSPVDVAPIQRALADYRAVLVGPGIGRADVTARFLEDILPILAAAGRPVVFDADALTLLSRVDRFWERLPPRSILTPHPGEMARLLGHDVPMDRIAATRDASAAWGAVIVLKGAYSVVAAPDGRSAVLPFANPALATAGTGDVLSGVIVGFMSQGLDPYDAVVAGGFVHGVAGELLQRDFGLAGGLAGDLVERLPDALRQVADRGEPSSARPWPFDGQAW